MSENQNGKSADASGKWGKWALVNAAVAAWLIYDMSTASEVPRQAVMLLQYFLLASALIGLAGSLLKLMAQK